MGTSQSNGSRDSKAWSESWTHLRIERRSRSYCRVTFDHPPINTITATTVAELAELVGLIEQDPDLNVVVSDSANPDFCLAHYDTEHDPARTLALGCRSDRDARVARPPRAPLSRPGVSIASIRGSARGARKRIRPRLRPAVRVARKYADRPVRGRNRGGSRVTLPPDSEFPPALADFFAMLGSPAQQARSARLEALGLNTDSDLERRLGLRVVEASND
jgi:hypothetical protein